ncbi:MAG: hypothetical protein EXS47_02025 [Candidatus Zambryskibacteria bacterium]|nr:hypothetical protein [Candidatus Zambryskibacteria bacterium]
MRTLFAWLIAILLVVGLYSIPSVWRGVEARSFAKFAEGGVSVETVPLSAMRGSGNPIGVPGGVGLMMGASYQFTNSKGETRIATFCNGHEDFWPIIDAMPNSIQLVASDRAGYRVRFELTQNDLEDAHTKNSWWIRHMGFERRLRVIPIRN